MIWEHLGISFLSLFIGTLLAPAIVATNLGIFSGEPLFIFYPAVPPVAYLLGGPVAMASSLILVVIALRNFRQGKVSRSLSFWVKRFCLLGGIVGGVSLSVPALCPKKRDLGNILTDLLYTVPNGVVTGSLCGFVLAIIWWKYDKKLDT
jgi:hypothetical protein